MIDPLVLRQDPDRVRESQRRRGESVELVDQAVAADEDRRHKIAAFEALRAEQKSIGKDVAKAQGDEKQQLLARTKTLAADVKAAQAEADAAGRHFDDLSHQFGNLVVDGVPEGGEDEGVVLETIGTPRDFAAEGFTPRDLSLIHI